MVGSQINLLVFWISSQHVQQIVRHWHTFVKYNFIVQDVTLQSHFLFDQLLSAIVSIIPEEKDSAVTSINPKNSSNNKLLPADRAVHDWYRFVLSYPPHLVRDYLSKFQVDSKHCILDPFCGTGTTLVECKKLGIPSVGVEASPMAYFASRVKVDWSPGPDGLVRHAQQIAEMAIAKLKSQGIEENPALYLPKMDRPYRGLPPDQEQLLLKGSMSPLPLHKALILLECIENHRDPQFFDHERLAFAKTIVSSSSNLHFGPEVGVGAPKEDAPVVDAWIAEIRAMAADLEKSVSLKDIPSTVHHADARNSFRPFRLLL